jgi:hypothetical protein
MLLFAFDSSHRQDILPFRSRKRSCRAGALVIAPSKSKEQGPDKTIYAVGDEFHQYYTLRILKPAASFLSSVDRKQVYDHLAREASKERMELKQTPAFS